MAGRNNEAGRAAVVVLVATAILAACEPRSSAEAVDADAPLAVDHHVHILSPELVRDWQSLGVPFSRPDSAYTSVTAALGGASRQAFLVSMAHIYGSEEFRGELGLTEDAEHARVRLANDHVAVEAAHAPEALVGFCSVDLLRPYARAEIERCRSELGLAGIKLHLPAAGIDVANAEHLRVLEEVAALAAREGRPLLVHLASPGAELRDERLATFIDRVVRPNPGLELYVAHLGGSGGYRAVGQPVVRAFTAFLRESDANARRPIYFELSGALLARETDGVPATPREDAELLAADLRELGLERVVFGSDYPVFDPDDQAGLLRERLPLSSDEIAQMLGRRGPALLRAAERRTR